MKTVIEMAREAGLHGLIQHRFIVEKHHQELSPKLEAFAALVREEIYKDDMLTDAYMAGFAAGRDTGFKDGVELATAEEREACAKVCDQRISSMFSEMFDKGWNTAAKYCAADIRARGE